MRRVLNRRIHSVRDRIVPERYHRIVSELVRFGAVGAVNTVIDFAVLNLLLSIGPIKAKIVAAIVATTASYFMNRHWTFNTRDRSGLRREYTLFFALNAVGLAIQGAVLGAAKYGLGFSEHGGASDRLAFNIASAVGIGIAMVFRFWAYRTFVFTSKPETDVPADVAAVEVAFTEVATAPAPRRDSDGDLDDELDELTASIQIAHDRQ